jgi:hypothetical protein
MYAVPSIEVASSVIAGWLANLVIKHLFHTAFRTVAAVAHVPSAGGGIAACIELTGVASAVA